ncbi:ATP-binding cassette domain-containing protein [Paeniclostridium sordellii]|nr:ATP-binding cassette domain-containing protein [Paeniclostridium sordellii]MSB59421.1 ATP-binding cassette domain-containing protein [Paeniclostridium sordellii]
MNQVLKVKNIEKYYRNKGSVTKAVDNISFEVNKGEFVGIMGASGSGKSTLLNCIATIDNVTAGNIYLDNKDITKMNEDDLANIRKDNIGFIFQDLNLLDTLSGRDNIALALSICGVNQNEIDKKIDTIANHLSIQNLLKKYPYEMSGGQKQKIACARAIVTNPALILADEPTGSLDSKSARIFLESLEDLNKNLNATILMVTHDAFTASYCDRILFIKDGKLFNELIKGNSNRKEFFNKIIKVTSLLGGDNQYVL